MDFLDSLDLDTTAYKKCHRVRSWYLYEQYKSLEKNQLDAAQRLKDKSYQDKILKQELKERRARRTLCDQFGSCHSESKIEKTIKKSPSNPPLSVSTDDIFESFCELHDEQEFDDFENSLSHDDSLVSKNFEEFANLDNIKNVESFNSVIKNINLHINLADDIKGELEVVKKNIAENINLQLENVKHNIECLEKYTKLSDSDEIPDIDSIEFIEQREGNKNITNSQIKFSSKNKDKVFPTWSKFVTFAYEIVQSNHGNFYNDYSTQIMIAVLALDVLRRGISIICNILQPYVCPVKYSSDSDITSDSYKIPFMKKSVKPKKRYKVSNLDKNHSCNRKKSCRKLRWLLDRECQSENKWQYRSQYSLDNRANDMKSRRNSEPWHGASTRKSEKKSNGKCNSDWPEKFLKGKFSEETVCKCRCLKRVVNPILQLGRYIESILQDIED